MHAFFLFFILFLSAFPLGLRAAEIKIGKVKLSCDRHKAPVSEWTDKIAESKTSCDTLIKEIKSTHEEHAKILKEAGKKQAEVSAQAVKTGTDARAMISSAAAICDSAAKEYEEAAKKAKSAAEALKKTRSENEKAIMAMKKRVPEIYEAERSRRVQIIKLKHTQRQYAHSDNPQMQQQIPELEKKVVVLEREKAPIDHVIKEEYYNKAIEEQGKAVTSARAMEKLMLDAERESQAKKADMLSKKAKLDGIKLESVGEGAIGGEISKIVETKAPAVTPEKESFWSKFSLTGHSDPVPENIASKEAAAKSALEAASITEAGIAKSDGKVASSGSASKLTEDIYDEVFESKTAEGKLANAGASAQDKILVNEFDTGEKKFKMAREEVDTEGTTERKVADVNDRLAKATVAELREDEELAGGAKRVKERSLEVAQELRERSQKIEELAKGMPQDVNTGLMKKVDENSPYYEQQKKISEEITARNAYLENQCRNTAVCAAVSDFGEKRTISEEDLSHKRNTSVAAALRGDRYVLKDGSADALVQAKREDAQQLIETRRDARIAAIEADAKVQNERAEGLQALRNREDTVAANAAELGLHAPGGGEQAIKVESGRLITDNSAAAGIVNNLTSDVKTKDELGQAFQQVEKKKELMETIEYLPGGGLIKAADSYATYSRADVQQQLLPESAEAVKVVEETKQAVITDVKMAGANLAVSAATGGIGGTITGSIAEKVVAGKLEAYSMKSALSNTVNREAEIALGARASRIPVFEEKAVLRGTGANSDVEKAIEYESKVVHNSQLAERSMVAEVKPSELGSRSAVLEAEQIESVVAKEDGKYGSQFWKDEAALNKESQRILDAHSEEPALRNFNQKQLDEIDNLQARIEKTQNELESKLEKNSIYEEAAKLTKAEKREILDSTKTYAEDIQKFNELTGREGGKIVKIPASVSKAGVQLPERFVYEMESKAADGVKNSGLRQHDIFLKQQPDYKIQFDPVKNIVQNTNGLQSESEKVLSLRTADINFSRRSGDVAVLHEGLHGRISAAAESGKSAAYNISFHGQGAGPRGYENFNSMQELAASRLDVKTAQATAREYAILKAAGKEDLIPREIPQKLRKFGIALEDISETGVIKKDFGALKSYRAQAEMDYVHLKAMEEKLEAEKTFAYSINRDSNGKDVAIFDARGKSFQAQFEIPKQETYFKKLPDGTTEFSPAKRHEVIAEHVAKQRELAEFHLKESESLMGKSSKPAVADAANKSPLEEILDHQVQKFGDTEKIAETGTKMGMKKGADVGLERMKGRLPGNERAQLASLPDSAAKSLGSGSVKAPIKGAASYLPSAVTSGIRDTFAKVPVYVGRVRDTVVDALPESIREVSGLSKSGPANPVQEIANSSAPSNFSGNSNGPVGPRAVDNGESASGHSQAIESTVTAAQAPKFPMESAAVGSSPGPSISVAGADNGQNGSVRVAGNGLSDINSRNGLGAGDNSSGISGGALASLNDTKRVGAVSPSYGENNSSRSGASSMAGDLAKAMGNTEGPPDGLSSLAEKAKKMAKYSSLKEKLQKRLADAEKGQSAGGGVAANELPGGRGPASEGTLAFTMTPFEMQHADMSLKAEQAAGYSFNQELSLFVRIRHMHIKHIEQL